MPHPSESGPGAGRLSAAGWRIVLLASLGGTLEFYDFVIFGVFARDIAATFFPASSPIASLMAAFAAFAAGYLARPFGGIVLSHYGDRFGRRRVFLLSLFVMSAATLGMGLVPPYVQWGLAASALVVLLRLIQGLCLGGELPGALTYVVETAPRMAPFVCGVVFACVTLGVAVATGVSLSVRTWLDPAVVPDYGWRIAFVLGGLGGVLSFLLRRSMEESPEFERMRAVALRRPFGELLRTHRAQILVGVAVLAATACFTGLYFSHLPAYLTQVLGYDSRDAVLAQTVGVVVHAGSILVSGWLGSRVAPTYLLRAGAVAPILLAWPFYATLASGTAPLVLVLTLAGIAMGLANGSFAVLLTDLFPTRIRFSGVALVFNIAFTLFSGMAPLAATTLIGATGSPASPALLGAATGLMALMGSFRVARYGGNVLDVQGESRRAVVSAGSR